MKMKKFFAWLILIVAGGAMFGSMGYGFYMGGWSAVLLFLMMMGYVLGGIAIFLGIVC